MTVFDNVLNRLKHFDAYPKPLEDFRIKTLSGAAITVFCTIVIIILFIFEWNAFMTIDIEQELFVDLSRNRKLTINLNITFERWHCALISVDAMDVSGDHQLDVVKGLKKIRLNSKGEVIPEEHTQRSSIDSNKSHEPHTTDISHINETGLDTPKCLSCYGAEASNYKCCNTCDDVRRAYKQKNWQFIPYGIAQCVEELNNPNRNMQASITSQDKEKIEKLLNSGEGCRLEGHLEVNKVAGNFHIAPGISYQQNNMHIHDIKNLPINKFNTSHYFETFSFGDEYPNQFNPLEKKSFSQVPPTSSKSFPKQPNQFDAIFGNVIAFNLFDDIIQPSNEESSISFSYFLKIVPTTYEYNDGRIVNNTYQYSVTRSAKLINQNNMMSSQLPGIFVSYELAPIMVKFIEKSKSFTHFLTSCCAIIGGLFTTAGILDAFVFRYYNMYKKYQMNKLT